MTGWDESARISSLGLRARPLDSSLIEIAWRARRESTLPLSSGVLDRDSKLDQCPDVEILARHSDESVLLDETDERIIRFDPGGRSEGSRGAPARPERDCQVLLAIDRSWDQPPGPSVGNVAVTQTRELGHARTMAPRNLLIPAAAVADVALFPRYVCADSSPNDLCALIAIQVLDELH